MPAKGTSLRNGNRYNPINKTTWESFKLDSGIDITYAEWVDIIHAGNAHYSHKIVNNSMGVKFPEYLGYVGTTRYKPKVGRRRIDWGKSNKLGTRVYHTNFHSSGYESRIVWITDADSTCRFLSIYKLVPDRNMSRATAPLIKDGKVYNELNHEHFRMGKIRINTNKLNGR